MAIPEEDYRQISEIQHFAFCWRQWALIHIEQQWKDNLWTTEGEIMHKRVHDSSLSESRGDKLIIRIRSLRRLSSSGPSWARVIGS